MDLIKVWVVKFLPVLQIIFVIVWLSNLVATDAYFSVYTIIALISFYLIVTRKGEGSCGSKLQVLHLVLASVFSFSVWLANYPIFTTIGDPALIGRSTSIAVNLIDSVFSLTGGVVVFYPIFVFCFNVFPIKTSLLKNVKWYHFLIVFASIAAVNLIHLFLVEYPGNATEDTFTQISEMASGVYSNFNTFWHTMLLRTILCVGYNIFGDLNASVALFCALQMALMAAAFTYCVVTMHALGAPKWFLVSSYLIFLLIPYNMAMSITIWKDVLFAASTLILLSSWIRIMKCIGKIPFINYVVFVLSSILFFLSRTNGWMIYLVTFLFALIPMRHHRRLIAVMGFLAVFGWFLLNPMLSMLGVTGSDTVESLSIPIQQVSRVIADGCDLSPEEEALLSRVVDLESVPERYTSWISDPMKEEIRSHDLSYFENNLKEYRTLWFRLGLRYPWEYAKAWVDQTKGYWNAGYDYFLYAETITDNPYGVVKTGGGNLIASLFQLYFGLSRHVIFFEPLHSIGLHIWILVLCFVLNVKHRRKESILSVPLLLLVIGLCFGTPVYSCFRYVYPLFVSFPLIVSTAIFVKE